MVILPKSISRCGKMNNKAIIFTLDAILAILAVSSIIIASQFYLSKTNIFYGQQDIYKMSTDSLTVLEKSRTLENAVKASSTSAIQNYLASLPNQICATITVYDKNSVSLLSATKTDCAASDINRIARRCFISNFESYYAEMIAWYK